MAYVERRGHSTGVTWRVVWRDGTKRYQESFGDSDAARRFKGLVDAAGQAYPAGWVPGRGFVSEEAPAGLTLDEFAPRALAARSDSTARTRADNLRDYRNHISPVLGKLRLDEITRMVAAEWLLTLQGSQKSITNWQNLLSSILNDAVEAELLDKNRTRGLARKGAKRPEEMIFLTQDEFGQLLQAVPGPYRPFVATLVNTGLRFGEATALQGQHLVGNQLHVVQAWKRDERGRFYIGEPKSTRSRRTLSLDAHQVALLARAPERTAFIFRSLQEKPLRHSNFYNRVWKPAVEASGLDRKPRIHDLRHTHVAWLIEQRVPLAVIRDRLGHDSITTTFDRYGHLVPGLQDDVITATGGIMSVFVDAQLFDNPV